MAYGSEVSDLIFASVNGWKDNPNVLHEAVNQAYLYRWQDVEAPPLEQVQAFCDAVLISPEYGVVAGLAEFGLSIEVNIE